MGNPRESSKVKHRHLPSSPIYHRIPDVDFKRGNLDIRKEAMKLVTLPLLLGFALSFKVQNQNFGLRAAAIMCSLLIVLIYCED